MPFNKGKEGKQGNEATIFIEEVRNERNQTGDQKEEASEQRRYEVLKVTIEEELIRKRNTWICCGTDIDKRCLSFVTQAAIGLSVMLFCMKKLTEKDLSCGAETFYVATLTSIFGYFQSPPTIN